MVLGSWVRILSVEGWIIISVVQQLPLPAKITTKLKLISGSCVAYFERLKKRDGSPIVKAIVRQIDFEQCGVVL